MFYREPLQWGKRNQTRSFCYHVYFYPLLCKWLFLHQRLIVILSEMVNMDDAERFNVNPVIWFVYGLDLWAVELFPVAFNLESFNI